MSWDTEHPSLLFFPRADSQHNCGLLHFVYHISHYCYFAVTGVTLPKRINKTTVHRLSSHVQLQLNRSALMLAFGIFSVLLPVQINGVTYVKKCSPERTEGSQSDIILFYVLRAKYIAEETEPFIFFFRFSDCKYILILYPLGLLCIQENCLVTVVNLNVTHEVKREKNGSESRKKYFERYFSHCVQYFCNCI